MGHAARWTVGNLGRFCGVWLVVGTVVVLAVPGEAKIGLPDSSLGWATLPVGIVLALFTASFVAFVALVLFLPVVGLWLCGYLATLIAAARLPSEHLRRLAKITMAPLLWVVFVHSGDHVVTVVSILVASAFGLVARAWPRGHAPGRSDGSLQGVR